MSRRSVFKSILISLIIIPILVSSTVSAFTMDSQNILDEVIAIESGFEFDLIVPWSKLVLEEVMIEQEKFVKLTVPGMENIAEEGAPSLPFISKAFGIPAGSEISLVIQPGKTRVIQLGKPVIPAESQRVEREIAQDFNGENFIVTSVNTHEKDLQIYQQKLVYPDTLGKVLNDGFVRNQRVIGIGLYPFQYQAESNQLVVYETMHVEVHFDIPVTLNTNPNADSAYYEEWFSKNLANYEMAKSWRVSKADLIQINKNEPGAYRANADDGWLPPDPSWKINVIEEGFYQVTYLELQAVGFPVDSMNPAFISMFNKGEEIAILIIGNDDLVFDSDESILFYAEKHNTKYTQENVYWLTYGETAGLRMEVRSSPPNEGEIPASFEQIKTMEENHYYLNGVPGEDDLERFLWNYIYRNSSTTPKSWSTTFTLNSPITDQAASLSVELLGYMENTVNPDHHVTVSLNNTYLGEAWWDGATWQIIEVVVPSGVLHAGTNTITLTCVNDTGLIKDVVYIDRIKLTYQSAFQVESDEFQFNITTPGTWKFTVGGFSTEQLEVFDVTDPGLPVRLTDFSVTGAEAPYMLIFEETLITDRSYWSGPVQQFKSVLSITADTPSNLHSETIRADYVLITHEEFLSEAQVLIDFRQTQGYDTVLVQIQDIYDEFGYGMVDAHAIHSFLSYAYQEWQEPAPSYVVLFGDGNYDPKDYLGYHRPSYIPPYLADVDPWIVETAGDNRYVTLVGTDTMPDMMLGRISIENQENATAVVEKIIYYEQNRELSDWRQRILAVADDADSAGNFAEISDQMMNEHVPSSFEINRVYYGVTHPDADTTRAAIQSGINNGTFIVNYIGHGSYTTWADELLFRNEFVDSLTNQFMYPIILSMTCYDGYYHRPGSSWDDYRSLAETITRASAKGAIASWSPTGLGITHGHDLLNSGFLDAIFIDGMTNLGEATLTGKFKLWLTGVSDDLLDTFLLFGDPATNINGKPSAVSDDYTTLEDTLLVVTAEAGVLSNDIDGEGQPLTAQLYATTSNGTLDFQVDGSFNYYPYSNHNGTDSFTYQAYDGKDYSEIITVTINITPVNDTPQTSADNYIILENETLGVPAPGVLANDFDADGDPIDSILVPGSDPEYGDLTFNNDGSFSYIPADSFSGEVYFSYKAGDGINESQETLVTILVKHSGDFFLPLIMR